jgi:hypothetical protein
MTNERAPGPNSTVAQRLRWARIHAGFSSDREAANARNLVVATYRKHESGELAPSASARFGWRPATVIRLPRRSMS